MVTSTDLAFHHVNPSWYYKTRVIALSCGFKISAVVQYSFFRFLKIFISLGQAGRCIGYDIGFTTLRRGFESRLWHCFYISEIGDRLWRVNYLGMSAGVKAGKSPLPGG